MVSKARAIPAARLLAVSTLVATGCAAAVAAAPAFRAGAEAGGAAASPDASAAAVRMLLPTRVPAALARASMSIDPAPWPGVSWLSRSPRPYVNVTWRRMPPSELRAILHDPRGFRVSRERLRGRRVYWVQADVSEFYVWQEGGHTYQLLRKLLSAPSKRDMARMVSSAAYGTLDRGWRPPRANRPSGPSVGIYCASPDGRFYVYRRPRPARCTVFGPGGSFGAGVSLTGLRWRHWGSSAASATGIEIGFRQEPAHIRVRVSAWRIRRDCRGHRVYTRLKAASRYGTTVTRPATCGRVT